jgi:hypothetical protein
VLETSILCFHSWPLPGRELLAEREHILKVAHGKYCRVCIVELARGNKTHFTGETDDLMTHGVSNPDIECCPHQDSNNKAAFGKFEQQPCAAFDSGTTHDNRLLSH